VVQYLSHILEKERIANDLQGIMIVREVKAINHSCFVDDTLLIGGASTIMIERFKRILDQFLNAFSGKVNNGKSHIYGWNSSTLLMQLISRILNFHSVLSWTSFKYLGMPMSLGHPKALD
jgi:hypothetical protein